MPLHLPPAQPFGPLGRLSLSLFVAASGALLLVFLAFPGLDLAVSGLAFDPVGGFTLRDDPGIEAVRRTLWRFGLAMLGIALAMTCLHPWRKAARLWPTRVWVFIVVLSVSGPGLLVNGVLKSFWGRARPREITEFGGSAAYSAPFQIVDACQSNCSFVSGEAAGAAVVGLSLVILAHGTRSPALRAAALVAGPAVAVVVAALRVAVGAHFLSDVVFAAILMWALAEILARFIPLGGTCESRQTRS